MLEILPPARPEFDADFDGGSVAQTADALPLIVRQFRRGQVHPIRASQRGRQDYVAVAFLVELRVALDFHKHLGAGSDHLLGSDGNYSLVVAQLPLDRLLHAVCDDLRSPVDTGPLLTLCFGGPGHFIAVWIVELHRLEYFLHAVSRARMCIYRSGKPYLGNRKVIRSSRAVHPLHPLQNDKLLARLICRHELLFHEKGPHEFPGGEIVLCHQKQPSQLEVVGKRLLEWLHRRCGNRRRSLEVSCALVEDVCETVIGDLKCRYCKRICQPSVNCIKGDVREGGRSGDRSRSWLVHL